MTLINPETNGSRTLVPHSALGSQQSAPARMAYILSASHSGSTLLAMLLGAQAKACTVGELRAPNLGAIDVYQCSCGRRIKECEFWIQVSRAMARRGIAGFDITQARTSIFEAPGRYAGRLLEPLQRGPLLELVRNVALGFSPGWNSFLKEVQHRNAALVEALKELTGAEIIIDSSKSVLHLNYLLKNPSLRIKVIQLIRDGRAVSLSLIGHGLQRSTRQETVAAAAREWRRSNEAAQFLLNRLPASQWMGVRYEQLCQNPQSTLRQLCQFLDLNTENLTLDFRSRQQHVLGNDGMRLQSTSAIRLDERWRTQLSAEDLSTFDLVAGSLNRRCGYS
jgi:hypothetical protein